MYLVSFYGNDQPGWSENEQSIPTYLHKTPLSYRMTALVADVARAVVTTYGSIPTTISIENDNIIVDVVGAMRHNGVLYARGLVFVSAAPDFDGRGNTRITLCMT